MSENKVEPVVVFVSVLVGFVFAAIFFSLAFGERMALCARRLAESPSEVHRILDNQGMTTEEKALALRNLMESSGSR